MSYRRNQNRKAWRKWGRYCELTPEMQAWALAWTQRWAAGIDQ